MKKSVVSTIKAAVLVSIVMIIICGPSYPLVVTGLSKLIFNRQASGNLIYVDGVAVGSRLVGQEFTEPYFLHGRPSSVGYNTYTEAELADGTYGGVSSGSNNYGASNPDLIARVKGDLEAFLAENPDVKAEEVPTDLLTASGSGLDPDISPESALVQVPRIAKASGLSEDTVKAIIEKNTSGKILGIFGQDRVNMLCTNLDIAVEMGLIDGYDK